MSVGATAELLVFIPWKAKEVQKEPQYVTRDYESARNAIVIYNLHHSQHELKQIGMIKLFCSIQSLQIFVCIIVEHLTDSCRKQHNWMGFSSEC